MAIFGASFPTEDWFLRTSLSAGVRMSATSGAVAITSALSAGMYVLCADHRIHWLHGNFTSGSVSQVQASVTDMILGADAPKYIWVWSDTSGGANGIGNDAVSVKSWAGSGGGYFWYARVI